MSAALDVAVSKHNGVWIVRPSGEVDMSTADEFRDALTGVHGPVLIDCSELRFIDASGLGVLAEVSATNGAMTLRGTSPFLRRTLDIVGMRSLLALEER
jgi:anti-anti-sigma factor